MQGWPHEDPLQFDRRGRPARSRPAEGRLGGEAQAAAHPVDLHRFELQGPRDTPNRPRKSGALSYGREDPIFRPGRLDRPFRRSRRRPQDSDQAMNRETPAPEAHRRGGEAQLPRDDRIRAAVAGPKDDRRTNGPTREGGGIGFPHLQQTMLALRRRYPGGLAHSDSGIQWRTVSLLLCADSASNMEFQTAIWHRCAVEGHKYPGSDPRSWEVAEAYASVAQRCTRRRAGAGSGGFRGSRIGTDMSAMSLGQFRST